MPRCCSIFIQSDRARRVCAARLHLAGEMDRAAEQQQLLGQRGLAGVGVRDDREGAARVAGSTWRRALAALARRVHRRGACDQRRVMQSTMSKSSDVCLYVLACERRRTSAAAPNGAFAAPTSHASRPCSARRRQPSRSRALPTGSELVGRHQRQLVDVHVRRRRRRLDVSAMSRAGRGSSASSVLDSAMVAAVARRRSAATMPGRRRTRARGARIGRAPAERELAHRRRGAARSAVALGCSATAIAATRSGSMSSQPVVAIQPPRRQLVSQRSTARSGGLHHLVQQHAGHQPLEPALVTPAARQTDGRLIAK